MEYEIQTFYFLKYPELFVCVILSNQRMNQVQRSEHIFPFPEKPRSGWSRTHSVLYVIARCWYFVFASRCFVLYIADTPHSLYRKHSHWPLLIAISVSYFTISCPPVFTMQPRRN